MQKILIGIVAFSLVLASCISDSDSGKKDISVSFRLSANIPDSVFSELFGTAKLKVTANDMPDISKECLIKESVKEISCQAPIPLGANRTFELFVYSKANLLSYYGKKANQEVKGTSNEFEISLYRLASDVTIKGIISDSLITTNPPADWVWTRDARGGGAQSVLGVRGDTLNLGPVDHVHFINRTQTFGAGIYSFKFKGSNFKFAWRVTPTDSTKGTALILQKAPGEKMALIHSTWSGFYFGWHNASEQFRNTVDLTFQSDTWHSVEITDDGTTLKIKFDGSLLDLFSLPNTNAGSFLKDTTVGFIGIGNNDKATIQYQGVAYQK